MFDEATYEKFKMEIYTVSQKIALNEFAKRKQRILDQLKITDVALWELVKDL